VERSAGVQGVHGPRILTVLLLDAG
jgi:hypothetical protein